MSGMKNFSNAKGYDRQLTTCYIIYMMGGSFFHRCSFASPYEETRLYLYYMEMPKQKQYECEDRVIRIMNRMDRTFLENIQKLNCRVRCSYEGEDCRIEFMTGGFEGLSCVVDKNGRFGIETVAATEGGICHPLC